MDRTEILNKFLENIINKNLDDAKGNFDQFVLSKSKEIVAEMRGTQVNEQLNEFNGDGAIKLSGDDVLVNGKIVGHVKTDLNDMDSGINFVSTDGRFSKEFDDMESLYRYISTTFGVKESVEETRNKSVKRSNEGKAKKNPSATEGQYPKNEKVKEENNSDGDQELNLKKVALKKVNKEGKVLPHSDGKKKTGNGKKEGENIAKENETIVSRLQTLKKAVKKG